MVHPRWLAAAGLAEALAASSSSAWSPSNAGSLRSVSILGALKSASRSGAFRLGGSCWFLSDRRASSARPTDAAGAHHGRLPRIPSGRDVACGPTPSTRCSAPSVGVRSVVGVGGFTSHGRSLAFWLPSGKLGRRRVAQRTGTSASSAGFVPRYRGERCQQAAQPERRIGG